MAEDSVSTDGTYSRKVGLLFVFNLIVGTGALALPKSFQVAGYGASIILIHVSCFTSFVCATFVIESMAIANAALLRAKRRRGNYEDGDAIDPNMYAIKTKTEVSEMAKLFLSRTGLIISYLLLVFYLFGDLAIYCTTVSKSIMNIVCDPVNGTVTEVDLCWRKGVQTSRRDIYRFAVFIFMVTITPVVMIGVTRTKYLQISTSLSRWTAFLLMIVLATISLIRDGPEASPRFANFHGFGSLFGTTVYAFMCHHSLPALVTPVREKRHLVFGIGVVYILILVFYTALSLTGSYAFQHVFDVYTLNFFHDEDATSLVYKIINYFLTLFPVFTLSTNYPIVANTLANNLCVLLEMFKTDRNSSADEERQNLLSLENEGDNPSLPSRAEGSKTLLKRCCLLVVVVVPMGISFFTNDVLLLASLTGSYPGVGVQYIIPSLLVLSARRYNRREFGISTSPNAFGFFKSTAWPCLMLLWSMFSLIMVTVNLFGYS